MDNSPPPVLLPEGPVPVHPRMVEYCVIASFMVFLTTLWTGLRLWSRRTTRTALGPEDYVHIAAQIMFYGNITNDLVARILGGFYYTQDELQTSHQLVRWKANFAWSMQWALTNATIKVSIILLMIRVFKSRRFFYAACFALAITFGWVFFMFYRTIRQCTPVDAFWSTDSDYSDAHCSWDPWWTFHNYVFDFVNELVIFILPIPMVWQLQTSLRHKFGLFCVFAIGSGTLIVVAIDLGLSHILASNPETQASYDPNTSSLGKFFKYSVQIELTLGLMASASLCFQPLLNRWVVPFAERILSRTSGSRSVPPSEVTDQAVVTIGGSGGTPGSGPGSAMGIYTRMLGSIEDLELAQVEAAHAKRLSVRSIIQGTASSASSQEVLRPVYPEMVDLERQSLSSDERRHG
jgi:hypothetical protein